MSNTLETRIKLKNDTEQNWLSVANSFIPLQGEPCVTIDGEHKGQVKYGDGISTWGKLKYSGEVAPTQYFEAEINDEITSDLDKIEEVTEGAQLAAGDVFVIIRTIHEDKKAYTAYVYNGSSWEAMDGNYDATNVYFKDNLVITANIGVQTIDSSGSKTLETAGKNVKQVFDMIVAQEKNPTITQPTASINSNNIGTKEVGTNIAIAYSFSTNAGNYQYGPATGVTFNNYSAVFNGETLNTSSGTFKQVQVTDNTNLTITGSVTHTDGAIPKTNLGNNYNAGKITSKTLNSTKGTLRGFRGWFYGYKNGSNAISNPNVISSAEIRALSSPGTSIPAQITTDQMKQMFFAIPKGLKTSVSVADATNGAPQTVTKITDIMVEGANGYSAIAYDVWYVNNAAAATGSAKFNITVK